MRLVNMYVCDALLQLKLKRVQRGFTKLTKWEDADNNIYGALCYHFSSDDLGQQHWYFVQIQWY